jgi:hypothetical protein
MSTVVVRDGDTVQKDPSDIKVYRFDWDTDALAAAVQIATSKFKLRVTTGAGTLLQSITSITRSVNTATVTTAAAHGYASGDSIVIDGAVQDDYNGIFTITVTGATTFTFTVSNTPATPATATVDGLTCVSGFDNVSILSADPYNSRYTQFRFSGGTLGEVYEISNRIVTGESPSQTIERSFFLEIENL